MAGTSVEPRQAAASPPPCTDEFRDKRVHRELIEAMVLADQPIMLCHADLGEMRLVGWKLREANLRGAKLVGADLTKADLSSAHLEGAVLNAATLTGTNFDRAHLDGAQLVQAVMHGTILSGTILRRADLSGADLYGASLPGADLTEAVLIGTDLTNTQLWHRNQGSGAELCHAVFEPRHLPDIDAAARAQHLWSLRFRGSPRALVHLRAELQQAGYRDEAAHVTFAIRRMRPALSAAPGGLRGDDVPGQDPETVVCDERDTHLPWMLRDATQWLLHPGTWRDLDGFFVFLAFDLPTGYGLWPGRPLRLLAWSIVVCSFVYVWPLLRPRRRGSRAVAPGIWDMVEGDLAVPVAVAQAPRRSRGPTARHTVTGRLGTAARAYRIALWFSIVSAFSVGWHDFDPGSWISRVQSRQHTLRGSGWVRTVSGLQALVSLYCIAVWAVTYFRNFLD